MVERRTRRQAGSSSLLARKKSIPTVSESELQLPASCALMLTLPGAQVALSWVIFIPLYRLESSAEVSGRGLCRTRGSQSEAVVHGGTELKVIRGPKLGEMAGGAFVPMTRKKAGSSNSKVSPASQRTSQCWDA